jgi:hypothetical protein
MLFILFLNVTFKYFLCQLKINAILKLLLNQNLIIIYHKFNSNFKNGIF